LARPIADAIATSFHLALDRGRGSLRHALRGNDRFLRMEEYQESSGVTDVGPVSHSGGGERFWLGDEFSPGVAGDIDDVVVGFEDEV
jgi:hypothetical protein